MILTWNDIQIRAKKFSKDWENAKYEKGETQTFYNEFFEVFGVKRRNVAIYEKAVKKLNNLHGFIDLFWEGKLLVEQKSAGRSLEKALLQATEYYNNLKDYQKPRFILLSDFQNFELLDLDTGEKEKFKLNELHGHIKSFGFIAGREKEAYKDQDPVNVKAAELISTLYHALKNNGFDDKDLEILLTRIVYCLFAEDTGIFPPSAFFNHILRKTNEDGSDTGSKLQELFQILDTPYEKRQKNLDEDLNDLQFINGDLFSEKMTIPAFDRMTRIKLLECAGLDWSKVSPALFGSLFQTVMLPEEQRQEGAHYTSEKNILKTIQPLFLDYLTNKFNKIKEDRSSQRKIRLQKLIDELSKIKVLDPACGCGNFLIISYREIRRLEIKILKEIYNSQQKELDLNINYLSQIKVDQFYGIEINHFASRIAKIALWLVDHQMNMELSDVIGKHYIRLPIYDTKQIIVKNALTFNWAELIDPKDCSYIIGNPPFVGSKKMTKEQKKDLLETFSGVRNGGELDYVSCWFLKASNFIENSETKVAFVSTNSITQGEQVGVLWEQILNKDIKIFFAHRTFKWTIDERRVQGLSIANVAVVIIGFSKFNVRKKELFVYEKISDDPIKIEVKNINPYLVEGENVVLKKRSSQINNYPKMIFGSMPNDNGKLLISDEEFKNSSKIFDKHDILKFIKPFVGAREFINNKNKWCIWLHNEQSDWRSNKYLKDIIQKVYDHRAKSKRPATKKLAEVPWLFGEIRHPYEDYILIPRVSSEKRNYIPIGYMNKEKIAGDSCLMIPTNDLTVFAILNSSVHMTWVHHVCGRLEDRYRYSIEIVYNNFPFKNLNQNQKKVLSEYANQILNIRKELNLSLEKLYDSIFMPRELKEVHQKLDKSVKEIYLIDEDSNSSQIMSKLFNLIKKNS
jgi:hypothetical protein